MSMPAYTTADLEKLLSVCCRELGTTGIVDDQPLDDIQWHGMLAAAYDHGLIGPLHRTASTASFVPDHILSSIRTAYLAQVARTFQLTTALIELIRAFAESAVEVAVVKGPAVALMAYDQISHRDFTDLDLLVRPADLKRARLVLEGLSYRELSREILNLNTEKDVQFLRDSDDTLVELHWALNPPITRFPLESTGIWDRLEIVYFQSEPMRALNIEDTLIALCIHASTHLWSSLKWSFDIAQILTRKADTLHWDVVLQRCTAVGCTSALLFGTQLTSLLFAVKTPTRLAGQISANPSLMTLVERVSDSLLQRMPLSQSDVLRCNIEIHDRLRDRLFVATLPFPHLPRLLPAAASPIMRGPLRFITRPVRLLCVYGFDWFRTVIVGR
jgi:hypothetical protein